LTNRAIIFSSFLWKKYSPVCKPVKKKNIALFINCTKKEKKRKKRKILRKIKNAKINI
jgi:hypothetical protein